MADSSRTHARLHCTRALSSRVFRFLGICLLLFASTALAQPEGKRYSAEQQMDFGEKALVRAQQLQTQGKEAESEVSLRDALAHFQEASKLAPDSTGPLLGIGLSFFHLRRCEEALPFFEQYLSKKGNDANPMAVSADAECKVQLKKGSYLSIVHPETGTYFVLLGQDIRRAGLTPSPPFFLLPGSYQVEFRAKGRAPTKYPVTLEGGEVRLFSEPASSISQTDSPQASAPKPRRLLWFGVGLVIGAALTVTAERFVSP